MRTIHLSDLDAEIIIDALRFKHAVLINVLSQQEIKEEPKEEPKQESGNKPIPRYGFKLDGTPRKPPGRPRKKRK